MKDIEYLEIEQFDNVAVRENARMTGNSLRNSAEIYIFIYISVRLGCCSGVVSVKPNRMITWVVFNQP
jgi:hypothetical protein